jgi:hypothetical protein
MTAPFAHVAVPIIAGLTAVVALLALLWIVHRINRHNHSRPEDPGLWVGHDYRCPDCGEPMAPGWVLLGKGAIWRERHLGRPGGLSPISRALPNTLSLRLRPAANMAWHCDRCRMLLLDHSTLVH